MATSGRGLEPGLRLSPLNGTVPATLTAPSPDQAAPVDTHAAAAQTSGLAPASGPAQAPGRDRVPSAEENTTPPRRAGLAGRIWAALAAPLLLSVVVQNAANFGFHAVVGRILPPGDYGALGAVLAIMVLLSVPLTALQAAASSLVSSHGWDDDSVRRTLRGTALWSVLAGFAVLAATPLIQDYFRLASAVDAAVLAPFVAVSVALAVARGLLLGDRQVTPVAWTFLLGTAGRLAFGLALVIPFGVTGALVGTLAGEVVALVVALVPIHRRSGLVPGAAALDLRTVAAAGFAVTGLFLFSTVDLLLARHYLPDAETGAYVAAATIGKVVLALPAAAMSVYYPRLVSGWRLERNAGALRTAFVVVSGLAILGGLVVAAVPGLLLKLLYGGNFADAAGLVRLLAVIAALTSIVSVLTYASLARKSLAVVVPWLGAALEIALIARSHGDASAVARGSLMALVPTLLVMVVWEGGAWWRAMRRGVPLPRGRHAAPRAARSSRTGSTRRRAR